MAPAGIGHDVEGVHAVAAAVAAGRVRRLVVEQRRLDPLAELIAAARASGAAIEIVDDVRPRAATEAPQGVVAEAKPIPTIDLEAAVESGEPAAVLVLDRVEDPRNVGAIARSALAAGIRSMVVASRRAAPLEATAFKTAAGALEHVAVAVVSSVADAVARLSDLGLWVVGLDGEARHPVWGCPLFEEPVAVVVGAEGSGLSRLVAERCDRLVRIPLDPAVESLNASVAAAIALFEIARIRGTGGRPTPGPAVI